jgi:SanA protein
MLARIPKWLKIAVASLVGAAVLLLALYGSVVWATSSSVYSDTALVPPTETALVLGASVKQNGELSPVLQARADAAVALYNAHKVDKILVTGDNSSVGHNEVNPTGRYLLSKGVPKENIFLDHAGFDTYSSVYRAKTVFGVTSLVIVSQSFHLPRALMVAHALGVPASAFVAQGDSLYLYNWAREVPATLKSMIDLAIERVPKYLGDVISIKGNGAATWADATSSISTTTGKYNN